MHYICNIWIVFDCIVYVHAYISILTLSQKYLIFLRNARKLLDFYRSSMPRSWQIPWIWPRDRASPGPARTASACPLPRHRVPRPSILHGNWDRSSDSPGDWKPERQAAAQQTSRIVRHVILRLLQSLDLIHSFVRSSCTHSLISLLLILFNISQHILGHLFSKPRCVQVELMDQTPRRSQPRPSAWRDFACAGSCDQITTSHFVFFF